MKFLILMMVLVPAIASGSELCSMMGGTCQDSCRQDQYAEIGNFEDCGDKQECCVQNTAPAEETQEPAQAPDREGAESERGGDDPDEDPSR